MSDKMQIYLCSKCESMAVILRGGEGNLSCCGDEMSIYKDTELESYEVGSVPPMEHNLTLPTKAVIRLIQTRHEKSTSYFGVQAVKNPLDAWVYQEIIYDLKPDVIVEIGNAYGGGTLSLAHHLDLIGKGIVVAVDIQHDTIAQAVREHRRISLITGDACESFDQVKEFINEGDVVLVIEDSEHTYENTINVLRTYSPIVSPRSYIIVEDSHCRHGLDYGPIPGPYEAIEEFVAENEDFESDRSKESFFITFNPKGYIRRLR